MKIILIFTFFDLNHFGALEGFERTFSVLFQSYQAQGQVLTEGLFPGFNHFKALWALKLRSQALKWIARSPPMYLGLVRAMATWADPMESRLPLTGTATGFKCMPMRVSPMSMPASA